MAERIVGIDFGTSTSVMRVKRYEENGNPLGERLDVKEVTFGIGTNMVPTLIRRVGDAAYYGHEALSPKRKSQLYQNFKIHLEDEDLSVCEEARKNTEEFFSYMSKIYHDQSDGGHLGEMSDQERTIVSYPVKWQEETRRFMLEAAKKAGFKNVEGMDEAQAAIQAVMVQSADYLKKQGYLRLGEPVNILMIDMGAGTTDLVLCRYTLGNENTSQMLGKNQILGIWPKQGEILFGGHEMEELLINYIKKLIPEKNAEMVLGKCGVEKFKSWKETLVSPALAHNETVNEFGELDDILELFDMEIDNYNLNRETLEKNCESYLREFPMLVKDCIENAGITADKVDLVILTGGHSQWYFVKEILVGKMKWAGEVGLSRIQEEPDRIIQITRPQETVALGLVYGPLFNEGDVQETRADDNNSSSGSVIVSESKEVSVDVEIVDEYLGENDAAEIEVDSAFPTGRETWIIGTVRYGTIKARQMLVWNYGQIQHSAKVLGVYICGELLDRRLEAGDHCEILLEGKLEDVQEGDILIKEGFERVQKKPEVKLESFDHAMKRFKDGVKNAKKQNRTGINNSIPLCYGDLVKEFINNVQAPPAKNGVNSLSDLFKRQMREYWELPEEEEIIYTPKGFYGVANSHANSVNRFYFTKRGISTHRAKKLLQWEKVNISWENFIKAGFDNKVVVMKLSMGTKNERDEWRYFYLDLQKYLRENASRL